MHRPNVSDVHFGVSDFHFGLTGTGRHYGTFTFRCCLAYVWVSVFFLFHFVERHFLQVVGSKEAFRFFLAASGQAWNEGGAAIRTAN